MSPVLAAPLVWATSTQSEGYEIFVTSDLPMVATLWQSMQTSATLTAFQTLSWLNTWQDKVGPLLREKPAIVVIFDNQQGPLCILPLAISGKLLRSLKWLGADLCDYNSPVLATDFASRCSPQQFKQIWLTITRLLRATPDFRFDLCNFDKMPEVIGTIPNPMLQLPVMRNASSAHIAHLGTDWDSYYAEKRSSATRKKERKQLKQLADYGEVRFTTVTDPGKITETLDILFAQKATTFARMGIENLFARPGNRQFFEALASQPETSSLVHLARLDIGDIPAAASYGLMLNGVYYLIISSYTDHDLARHGPGRVHLSELMGYAITQGIKDFDFTIGDESYKRLWADLEMPIYDHAAGYSLPGMAVSVGLRSYRLLKRTIKQNPKLWEAYTQMRVLIGG